MSLSKKLSMKDSERREPSKVQNKDSGVSSGSLAVNNIKQFCGLLQYFLISILLVVSMLD